jgi:hypothetical protein
MLTYALACLLYGTALVFVGVKTFVGPMLGLALFAVVMDRVVAQVGRLRHGRATDDQDLPAAIVMSARGSNPFTRIY